MRRAAVLVAALPLLLTAGPAWAATAFGPPRVVAAPCPTVSPAQPFGDAAFAAGTLRAFVGSAGCGGRLVYAEGGSQGWRTTPTPYRGNVLAVAADEQATYLLLVPWDADGDPTGLAVTKRTHDGRFLPLTVLSSTAGTGAVPATGDLAARGGRWWAVWAEQVGPGGEFAHQQLFQAGSVAGLTRTAQQRTSTAADVDDSEPTLTLDDRGAVIAWTRTTQPARPGPSDVWVAVSTAGTWERARAFGTAGEQNTRPDVVRVGAATLLAFERDGRVAAADDSSGTWHEHVFLVRGSGPRVGIAGGRLMAAWSAGTETDASARVLFASSSKGGRSWEGSWATPPGEPLLGLVGTNGRGTVLSVTGTQALSRTGVGMDGR